jgi:hypothetical protein
MKIYELVSDPINFASLVFRDPNEAQKWGDGWFDGSPRGPIYPVPKAVRIREGVEKPKQMLPDFTHIGRQRIPIFSSSAVAALAPVLRPHGELAALLMDELVRYYAFNATTILDLLGDARSEISGFNDGVSISVDRHYLLDSVSSLPPVFKMAQTRRNTTYVNEGFVQLVKQIGLTGFRFEMMFEC